MPEASAVELFWQIMSLRSEDLVANCLRYLDINTTYFTLLPQILNTRPGRDNLGFLFPSARPQQTASTLLSDHWWIHEVSIAWLTSEVLSYTHALIFLSLLHPGLQWKNLSIFSPLSVFLKKNNQFLASWSDALDKLWLCIFVVNLRETSHILTSQRAAARTWWKV